jgi:hypothetical protein
MSEGEREAEVTKRRAPHVVALVGGCEKVRVWVALLQLLAVQMPLNNLQRVWEDGTVSYRT